MAQYGALRRSEQMLSNLKLLWVVTQPLLIVQQYSLDLSQPYTFHPTNLPVLFISRIFTLLYSPVNNQLFS